ncbi:MAG TPA: 4Fe-4S dicluster domain-containing protein [Ktedonobacterales bacterium]|nr:4Fe-4S dicluster domain-containing protein [Ktedonobacterales bacterium]
MAKGFFTDTTLCIGCKACEVACKQWNQLPADSYRLSGMSYDNTVALGATTWRHVAFIEQFDGDGRYLGTDEMGDDWGEARGDVGAGAKAGASAIGERMARGPAGATDVVDDVTGGFLGANRWLMMSDVCKHCTNAGCLEACPTGAIIRNEFGDVYVQPDICNGCGYCVWACPFGVISINEDDGRAWKCTLCYDRQRDGLVPACAKACPTQSIQFGEVEELRQRAAERVGALHARGITSAYLYGADEHTSVGNLNAFFLLADEPQVYNLPEKPHVPQAQVIPAYVATVLTGIVLGVATLLSLGRGRERR